MPELVSVVVPAWNVAGLLPRCLDSLLAQRHRPLEILVVDDGSTDGTREVALDYHRRHEEVHVVVQRHRGLGPARNAALSIAHGDYVCFVDADDWVGPDHIAGLLGTALATRADVVVGGFRIQLWGGVPVPLAFRPRPCTLDGQEAARRSLNLVRMPSFAWNRLYRRSLFHADDPPFPSVWYEDLATIPRVLARATKVEFSHDGQYHYCLRRDSITGNFTAWNVFSMAAAVDILRRDLYAGPQRLAWSADYRRLLRQVRAMATAQVLLQPNRIPLRTRLPLLARFRRRLRALADAPQDGHELQPHVLRGAEAESTLPRRPLSGTVRVAPPNP